MRAHPRLVIVPRRYELLARLPVLKAVPSSGLRALAYSAVPRATAPGEAVYREGDPCAGLELMLAGAASVRVDPAKAAGPIAAAGRRGRRTRNNAPATAPAAAPATPPPEAQIAEVGPPELLGVVDLMPQLVMVPRLLFIRAALLTRPEARRARDPGRARCADRLPA